MKIKTVKEQLIELGLKSGDSINIEWSFCNPHTINLEKERLYDRDACSSSLNRLNYEEFEKYIPTKEELLAELKKRSKRFEKGKDNYVICYCHLENKVYPANYFSIEIINTFYFDRETAQKICQELKANKEKTKILFDLE